VGNEQWQFEGGAFHDSLPNGRSSGRLEVSPVSIKFVSDHGEEEMPITGLQTELGGAANRMLFLKHSDCEDWTFFTTDLKLMKHPVFAKDERLAESRKSVSRTRWMSRASAMTFLGAIIAIPLGLWWAKDPVAAAVAGKIPVEMEQKIGDAAFTSHAPSSKLITDEDIMADFEILSKPLIEAIDSKRYTFEFHILEDSSLNAFALPGGKMAIHTGLILKAERPEEVLGVMAHELAHVEMQHSMRNLVEMVGMYAVISALFGDVSGIAAILVNNAPFLLQMKFSRDHEREADEKGFEYLTKANIDPRGLMEFFEKIQKEHDKSGMPDMDGALSVLTTHPATDERINNLKRLINSQNNSGAYRKFDLDFKGFQERLRNRLNK
jgi:predicted Zn-dependent protease